MGQADQIGWLGSNEVSPQCFKFQGLTTLDSATPKVGFNLTHYRFLQPVNGKR
jgi:hypothetical protein